jgi:hypothetical protein
MRAETHSVRVVHQTTIDESLFRIDLTVADAGSTTQRGTIAEVSQNFTSLVPVPALRLWQPTL